MSLSIEELLDIIPNTKRARLETILPHLNETMDRFYINTPTRQAMFIAQMAHESMGFARFEEFASGVAYEGREDLGNTSEGDGKRFKGRGAIQLTGRGNYRRCGQYFGWPLLQKPELLSNPREGCLSAGWFWFTHKLNEVADGADEDSFYRVTRKINGGLTGIDQRLEIWDRCKAVLNVLT